MEAIARCACTGVIQGMFLSEFCHNVRPDIGHTSDVKVIPVMLACIYLYKMLIILFYSHS